MADFLNALKNSLSQPLPKRLVGGECFIYLHRYDLELSYQLKVSARRKTLALELQAGLVTVRSPHWLSPQDIEGFILSKQDWLMDKLQNQAQQPTPCQYQDGDLLLFFGDWYQLNLQNGRQFSYVLDQEQKILTLYVPLRVKDKKAYVKAKLKAIYMALANEAIPTRFFQLQQRTGFQASGLALQFFKSRWGCCYQSGLIKINPMLMGAPQWVLDCVLIHELCHLTHMDHSKAFWRLNQVHCADCQNAKAWLKQHSINLHLG